ncbi:hypothetical protein BaRGS_00013917 [Batillaria attramentaria]|uniref:Uncharacterized protein n=1 Tax=Batillaria attramentaria TaxID=370345 RepID=A0ABD0L5X8_9CAEN
MNVDHQLTGFLAGLDKAWLLECRGIKATKADCRFLFRDTDMSGVCWQRSKLTCTKVYKTLIVADIHSTDHDCIFAVVILNMAIRESGEKPPY